MPEGGERQLALLLGRRVHEHLERGVVGHEVETRRGGRRHQHERPQPVRPRERGLQHGRPTEAVADADRGLEAQLVADGDEVGGVLLDRAPLPRRRPTAGAAADEVERRDPEPVEVDALDERIPRRVVVLEPVHEDEVGAGTDLLDGDLGVADREPLPPLTPRSAPRCRPPGRAWPTARRR